MALPTSGNEINFGALADNRDSSSRANISLRQESQLFASGAVGPTGTSRDNLNAEPHALSEFGGADYPNTVFSNVVAKLSTTTVSSYVDGETGARIYWDVDDGTTDDYTAGLKLVSDNSIVLSETLDFDGYNTTKYVTLGTIPNIAEGTDKYYPFVSTGTYTNAVGSNLDHYDQLAGTNIDNVAIKYVDASSDTTVVTFGYAVSAGTVTGRTWTFGNASNGEGSARTPTTSTSTNTPSVTYTGTGLFPVDLTVTGNPSAARNTHTATQENVDIRYNKAIDSLARDDDTINVSAVDGSNNLTISAVSEGHNGTLYIGYDDNDTASDKTFTNSSEAVNTLYVRESVSKNFTISSAGTYYIKAYHNGDTNATVGGQVIVAPALSYSKTGNQTINVNQTQAFSVSSLVGNNKQVVISSEDSIGGATLTADGSATMTPGANNKVYTITFTGTADYSQTNNQTSTLTVNPTVSVSVSPGSGTFYPTTDTHGDPIGSSTHGVTPTTFTFTPTAVGNNITTYSWSITNFSFTSGNSSTQGAVSGKYTSGGSKSSDLTVSGTDSTSGTTSFDQSITTVTKAITNGAINGVLRQGSNIVLSGVAANYVQNMRVQRHNGSSYINVSQITSDISGAVTIASLGALERDTTSRNVRLIDTDSTATLTFSLGNATVLGLLPTVDSFSVSQGNLLGELELTWTTSNASTVSINNSIGSVNADDSTSQTGIGNNTSRTYIITATNADGESVTDSDSATTINPSLTIPNNPSVTSWTKGDTGNLTIAYTKNFDDTVPFEMGVGLTAGGGGTVYQSINVSSQSGTITFNKNYMHGTSFGTVIDFRIGNATSGRVVRDNTATFSDFSAPGQASNNNSAGASGTSINIVFNAGSNATRHIVYNITSGTNSGDIAMPGTSHTFTGLSTGTSYTFRVDAIRDVTTTPNGSSTTTTKTTTGATFTVATFTWQGVTVYGATMGSTSGTGFSTVQETAVLGSTSNSRTLYYRSDIQTPGSTTVSWKRGIDQGAWAGDGSKYFRIGSTHIGIIDGSGEMDANQYIANSVAIPIAPTSWSETSTGTTNIEMSWTDNSAIEDDFKVYRKEGSAADSGDTLAGTVPANNGAFDDTGLSNNSAPTISAFGDVPTSDSVVISGNITNRILFTASGIDDYELKFNTTGHSNPYSSTAISKTSSGISGGSINQLLLHSGVTAATTHYYQITAYKDGKTYYYAVYANNGGTLSTSAATGNATLNQVTSTSTTSLTSTSNASLSSPSNIELTLQDNGGYTVSSVVNWSLTGGYTTTSVTFTYVSGDSVGTLQFAASTSDSTPDSYQNENTTYNLGSQSGSGNIYVRCRGQFVSALAGNQATYRITVTHGTASDSVDVTVTHFDEGGGFDP